MSRWLSCLLVLLLSAPVGGLAQGGSAEADALRQQVLARWRARVRTELQLTDEQAERLAATEDRFLARRRELAQRQRAVLMALRDQIQSEGAANPDSVRRLMESREQNRAALGELEAAEDREVAGYLSPVQHARYQFMRQRLQERIAELRRQYRNRRPPP